MGKSLFQQVDDELRPGERLIWTGGCLSQRGKQARYEGKKLAWFLFLIFVSLWALATIHAFASGEEIGGVLGLLFGLVLLAAIPLSLRDDAYRKSKTIYALTDWRVLILRDPLFKRQVRSVPLRFVAETRVRDQRHDGRGTIDIVGQLGGVNARLFMIGDCSRVQELILDARSKAFGPPY